MPPKVVSGEMALREGLYLREFATGSQTCENTRYFAKGHTPRGAADITWIVSNYGRHV